MVTAVIVLLAGSVLLAAQMVTRMNSVPAISISDVTTAEAGCLTPLPRVTFNVTLWNMAFGNGIAQVSFYRDSLLLGSEHWSVDGRTAGIVKSVTYGIPSCGGHVYGYHLDNITGP